MATQAAYQWLPSSARVVYIEGFGILPRGSIPLPPVTLAWPAKDPLDTLDYVFDISAAISGNEGDTIATLDVAIAPANAGDLLLNSARADGDQAVLWFSAGIAGTTYGVTVTISTNSGRVINRTIELPVIALSSQPMPANAITDQAGNPITDQNSNPITTY